MDELDLLTKLRAEVPLAAPSPRAEYLFRVGLAESQSSEPARLSRRAARRFSRLGGRCGLLSPHATIALALAAAVTAAILIMVLPSGQRPVTVPPSQASRGAMSLQLLADLAAKAAQSGPSVPPGQWVYRKVIYYPPGGGPEETDNTWTTADGTKQYVGDVADGEATIGTSPTYSQLLSLPKNPAALDTYLAHLEYPNPDATQANKDVADFITIESMLADYVLPPALTAELYHALGDIPTVTAKTDVTDIDGRSGIAFVLPATPQSVNLEIIISSTDYRMLAQAAWGNVGPTKRHTLNTPVLFNETAILSEAFVSGPGVLPK